MPERIVFMGSPDFSLPSLRALAARYQLVGVVTQPDRPAGRGQRLTPPPVKRLAEELGLPVIQPRRLREPEAMAQLAAWAPDLLVVVAFGQILRPDVLSLPPNGCINVHASLLPRWRGAAPIQAAILAGDKESGVTIMRMDPGVDTGDILAQAEEPVLPEDTAGSLSERLSILGAQLLAETLPRYLDGSIQPRPQDPTRATLAPMLKKEDGQLDFTQSAASLARRVRAFAPWPGTYTLWQGQPLKVHQAHVVFQDDSIPEKTYCHDRLPAVGAVDGLLVLDEVQPAGKRSMPGADFLRGSKTWGKQ
jgi:methionyl-tRNA formyltransferase